MAGCTVLNVKNTLRHEKIEPRPAPTSRGNSVRRPPHAMSATTDACAARPVSPAAEEGVSPVASTGASAERCAAPFVAYAPFVPADVQVTYVDPTPGETDDEYYTRLLRAVLHCTYKMHRGVHWKWTGSTRDLFMSYLKDTYQCNKSGTILNTGNWSAFARMVADLYVPDLDLDLDVVFSEEFLRNIHFFPGVIASEHVNSIDLFDSEGVRNERASNVWKAEVPSLPALQMSPPFVYRTSDNFLRACPSAMIRSRLLTLLSFVRSEMSKHKATPSAAPMEFRLGAVFVSEFLHIAPFECEVYTQSVACLLLLALLRRRAAFPPSFRDLYLAVVSAYDECGQDRTQLMERIQSAFEKAARHHAWHHAWTNM